MYLKNVQSVTRKYFTCELPIKKNKLQIKTKNCKKENQKSNEERKSKKTNEKQRRKIK